MTTSGINIGTRVTPELKERLDQAVRQRRKKTGENVSASTILREALERYLEEMADRQA